MTSQPFSQTGKMTDLCCEYLSVRFIWMYVITMSSCQYVIIMPCLLLSYHLYASNRRSRPEVFLKKLFWIDKFRKIHGKILALQFFLIRLQAAGLQLYWKETPAQVFSSQFCVLKRDWQHIFLNKIFMSATDQSMTFLKSCQNMDVYSW